MITDIAYALAVSSGGCLACVAGDLILRWRRPPDPRATWTYQLLLRLCAAATAVWVVLAVLAGVNGDPLMMIIPVTFIAFGLGRCQAG